MTRERNWTVLFIGGASGVGKSSLAYEIAGYYGVNVLEVDDIQIAVKAVTTRDRFPAIHYWETGVSWFDMGVDGNVKWLTDVSKELIPALGELVNRHIEDQVPIIIEGDFLDPEFTQSFDRPEVRSIFISETDVDQIIQNYLSREGGERQQFRAEVSVAYNKQITEACEQYRIKLLNARPWDTLLERAMKSIE